VGGGVFLDLVVVDVAIHGVIAVGVGAVGVGPGGVEGREHGGVGVCVGVDLDWVGIVYAIHGVDLEVLCGGAVFKDGWISGG
jgi:hypothetical protein